MAHDNSQTNAVQAAMAEQNQRLPQASAAFETLRPPPGLPTIEPFSALSNSSSQPFSQTLPPLNQALEMESKPYFDIMTTLMSPPEPTPYESFSRSSPAPPMASQLKPIYPKIAGQFLSPPVSPDTKVSEPEEPASTVKDPILYPSQDTASTTSSQPPLFHDAVDASVERVIENHISARALRKRQFRESSPPHREDYLLALEFKSQVAKLFSANPRAWHMREREYLLQDQKIRMASLDKKLVPLRPSPAGVYKTPKHVAKGPSTPRQNGVRERRVQRPERQPHYGSATPEPQRHRVSGTTTREDKDFASLPDYSPPLSTLPNRPNSLKVEWKGAPIDLSHDPHRDLLHPDELALAANLRLDCATYLTSKRRIFIARIECAKIGKEFRKTDSQQACKIDVNKASKLWAAFDRVGWLKLDHFKQYLN